MHAREEVASRRVGTEFPTSRNLVPVLEVIVIQALVDIIVIEESRKQSGSFQNNIGIIHIIIKAKLSEAVIFIEESLHIVIIKRYIIICKHSCMISTCNKINIVITYDVAYIFIAFCFFLKSKCE